MMSLLKDFGYHVAGEALGDASAALGIINRKGLGKTRHIDIGLLWIQQVAAERRLKFGKALGRDNPADLFTKYLDQEAISRHCRKISATFPGGRAETAPTLHNMIAAWGFNNNNDKPTTLTTQLAMSIHDTQPPTTHQPHPERNL